jgi:hypothetical protein
MANFGARLAYPTPDRIVARQRAQQEIASREALERSTPFQRAVVRVVLALLGVRAASTGRDEYTLPIPGDVRERSRRVA